MGANDGVGAALEMIETGYALLSEESFDTQSHPELLAVLSELEAVAWKHPGISHKVINRLAAEADPKALGGKNLADLLATALRVSTKDAKQRIKDAALLGPRAAITGETLEPTLPNVAAAQQRGEIGPEHVSIIDKFFRNLPGHIDYQTREAAEVQLAQIASEVGPEQLREAAERLALLLNQDGDPPDDAERARRRYFTVGRQGADGMVDVHGRLDPECAATLDAVVAKWGAPGMCNPDDEQPCVDGDPSAEAVNRDTRTVGQRNHDALKAMGRSVLSSGQLGQHNGLPATIIVSTTLQQLQSGAGHAVTAGGTLLPMSDLIRLAGHAYHYLSVYDEHTNQELYLARTKRFASPAQRIVLLARDRGCTRPGCTAPGYWSQVHHVNGWAKDDGHTNVNTMTLACGPDNRLVEQGGWGTRKRKDGRTEWIPPPHLDTGQRRVNNYHHPEKYLLPEDDAVP